MYYVTLNTIQKMEEYMGKRGFTLSELLIVLAVTGIVAAIILPVIDGLMPDKTKINYLKAIDETINQ